MWHNQGSKVWYFRNWWIFSSKYLTSLSTLSPPHLSPVLSAAGPLVWLNFLWTFLLLTPGYILFSLCLFSHPRHPNFFLVFFPSFLSSSFASTPVSYWSLSPSSHWIFLVIFHVILFLLVHLLHPVFLIVHLFEKSFSSSFPLLPSIRICRYLPLCSLFPLRPFFQPRYSLSPWIFFLLVLLLNLVIPFLLVLFSSSSSSSTLSFTYFSSSFSLSSFFLPRSFFLLSSSSASSFTYSSPSYSSSSFFFLVLFFPSSFFPLRPYFRPSMRSSQVLRASGCQCQSRNSPEFDPSIIRDNGIWGAAEESVLNKIHKNKNSPSENIFALFMLFFLVYPFLPYFFLTPSFTLSLFHPLLLPILLLVSVVVILFPVSNPSQGVLFLLFVLILPCLLSSLSTSMFLTSSSSISFSVLSLFPCTPLSPNRCVWCAWVCISQLIISNTCPPLCLQIKQTARTILTSVTPTPFPPFPTLTPPHFTYNARKLAVSLNTSRSRVMIEGRIWLYYPSLTKDIKS